jgi:CubicO group peptidase (beta-lactamase class C family)
MKKTVSVLGLLLAALLLTNLITRNSFASNTPSNPDSAAETNLESAAKTELKPSSEGGATSTDGEISTTIKAPDPAEIPLAESEITSTKATGWAWYYGKTVQEINDLGKQNNLRPITLTQSGSPQSDPHFNVLFVKNVGVYKVDQWQVVGSRTAEAAKQLDSPAFRKTNWRISGVAWHQYANNSPTETRLATIMINDNLYLDYDVRVYLTQAELQELPKQGFRVVDFDSYRDSQGHYLYAAVIVPNKGEHYKRWGWLFVTSRSNIIKTAESIDGKAYRITDIERREDGNYDALLVEAKGESTHWYTNLTDETLKNDVLRRHGSWNGGPGLRDGIRFTDIVQYFDDNHELRYEVLTMENGIGDYPIARDNVKGFEAFDDTFIRTMTRNGIPGASFALAKNGKVIYRAAYGYASLSPAKAATVDTRGRLASISKTITSAAIMRLVQEGKLDLGATVFGPNGLLKDLKPFSYAGYKGNNVATLDQIKVHHLLSHTAGWDRGTSGDPSVPVDADRFSCNGSNSGTECEPTISMSQTIAQHARNEGSLDKNDTRGASIDEVIRWMIRPDDKDFLPKWAPGTKQVYSNFGFIVLQKIIELKSQQTYRQYIQNMTAQMGVTLAVGKSDPALVLANEWTYYDNPGAGKITKVYWSSKPLATAVAAPYVYDMNTMLGHGGWVASPQELVKFASKLDSTAPSPWISWTTFRSMMNRPAGADPKKTTYYGLNWGVDPLDSEKDDKFHYSHGGSLLGAKSLLLKGMTERKVSLAFLFNSSADTAGNEIGGTLNTLITTMDDKGILAGLAK